ncbi:P-loop containing nucleoside triphosphate hydrolase protein [Thelephora ganbajun]|uniref:P-loop containing nucleoside triphosphate hydrolase protein n=1 Tax=Thelephora ganbajun TaxID=370292 RepID=A0ACB6ZP80_THEGA|nr:P-loop containing nucleoside triphosphate hydrolase protein [Thelephora ganbajun]
MSDDYFFGDEDFENSAIIAGLDAFEAAHNLQPQQQVTESAPVSAPVASRPVFRPPPRPALVPAPSISFPKSPLAEVVNISDDDEYKFDDSLDLDDANWEEFDQRVEAQAQHPQNRTDLVLGPSTITRQFSRTSSGKLQQQTLWGLPVPPENRNKLPPRQRGKTMKKTKTWDRTEYAKTGWRVVKNGKNKSNNPDGEGEQEEMVEFEQFPRPTNLAVGPVWNSVCAYFPTAYVYLLFQLPPMRLTADRTAAEIWIYPLNRPKRDYQFNIVRRCLFDNTLVALPTGLGKTFIAGSVMLNFYRWFPSGKVIFVAPSKPLVAQQIEACHQTCGIPGSDAVELTGEVPRKKRIEAWEEKRVFYMTPQTLMNDLLNGACDPSRIILLVIDEAHKGKGNYAYAQLIRELMHKNPHFRVLALTATPGGKPDDVQELCDALHISHIEIRDEFSPDLKQYIFEKEIEQHIVGMSGELLQIRSLLADLMKPLIGMLQGRGVLLGNPDPVKLHPFRCQAEIGTLADPRKGNLRWAMGPLSTLGKLARAMGYLCEESAKMCYDALKAMNEKSAGKANSQKKAAAITNDQKYKDLIRGLEMQKEALQHFPPHPKMEKLKSLVLEHLLTKGAMGEDGEPAKPNPNTRVMVFVSFRDCVEEVVEYLNLESPIIRATKFVGQGTDKGGRKGFAQKEQLEVIQKFKTGEFNLLVSTSIGEEGLDIGEIDLIVCYDAQKTPVRMLQRIGRTGRKRSGHVHVLLAQGREEANWDKAQETYQRVQHVIVNGDQLELFGDVDRLIPDDVNPVCKEQIMEIEEYVRDRPKARGSRAADSPMKTSAGKKRKRNADPGRNIPEGATRGFVPVSELIERAAKKRQKDNLTLDDDGSLKSDDDDRDLEENLSGLRRTTSDAGPATAASKAKKPLKRSKTAADDGQRRRTTKSAAGKGKKGPAKPLAKRKKTKVTSSQVDQVMEDDKDDEALEEGLLAHSPPPANQRKITGFISSRTLLSSDISGSLSWVSGSPPPTGSPLSGSKPPVHISLSPSPPPHAITLDLVSPSPPSRAMSPDPDPLFPDSSQPQVVDPQLRKSPSVSRSSDAGPSMLPSISNPSTPLQGSRPLSPALHDEDGDMSWLIAEDERDDGFIAKNSVIEILSSPPRVERQLPSGIADYDDDVSIAESSNAAGKQAEYTKSGSTMIFSSPQPARTKHAMLPPPVPPRVNVTKVAPESTFPVRPMLAKRQAKRKAPMVEDNVDVFGSSPRATSPPRRLRQRRSRSKSPPPGSPLERKAKGVVRKGKIPRRDSSGMLIAPEWVENEAAHSGDEISDGAISGTEDQSENEYDREFVNDFPSTQVSPSYNQTQIYRESLLTQAPRGRGPAFARGPMRHKPFGDIDRRLPQYSVSSSPPRDPDEGPDEYEMDSFVVPDDAEITYSLSSDV